MGLGLSIRVGESPDAELASASAVEVVERVGEPTRFTLRYPIDVADGDFPALVDARLGPESALAIVAVVDGQNHFLVKGQVHRQNVRIHHGGGDCHVEVVGTDLLVKLDREVRAKVWSDVTAADVVTQIASSYGLTAACDATPGNHSADTHEMVQRETDLRFVRRLAKRFGCYFWLSTDPLGVQTANFKRPELNQAAAATLQINKGGGAHPHIAWLDLSWDVEAATQAAAADLDVRDASTIDGAVATQPLPLLGTVAASAAAPAVRAAEVVGAGLDAGQLKARTEAALIDASWFTRARCQTSLKALGKLVRPYTVVDLAGVGTRHSGAYFVAGVRHLIDPTQHLMELDLYRNAWSA